MRLQREQLARFTAAALRVSRSRTISDFGMLLVLAAFVISAKSSSVILMVSFFIRVNRMAASTKQQPL